MYVDKMHTAIIKHLDAKEHKAELLRLVRLSELIVDCEPVEVARDSMAKSPEDTLSFIEQSLSSEQEV